ncbi:hypothetical protein BDI4_450006 [Burkholderia diffusa]|nr:hypothetical protein BDI4_450006 [Burkholderia diffusa]
MCRCCPPFSMCPHWQIDEVSNSGSLDQSRHYPHAKRHRDMGILSSVLAYGFPTPAHSFHQGARTPPPKFWDSCRADSHTCHRE